MVEQNISSLAITDDNYVIVGIMTDRDLVKAISKRILQMKFQLVQ